MKIGLVTNWGTKCAVAEYAKDLADNCLRHTKEVEFKIVTGQLNYSGVAENLKDVDIIHFNYCGHAFMTMESHLWPEFRKTGKPVIFTFHESADWKTRRMSACGIADWIVIHGRMRDGAPVPINVRHIPFGVSEIDISGIEVEAWKVGTFGCAFPWKTTWPLAYVCGQLNVPFMAMLSEPDSDAGNTQWQKIQDNILEVCPQAEIITGWRPIAEVVRRLATCSVVALPFDPGAPINGISASARFALAARRPLVVTAMAHFSDLYDYDDEVYFENGNLKEKLDEVLRDIAMGRAKVPEQVVKDMSWQRSAAMYCNLYKEALQSKVSFIKEAVNVG